MRENTERHITKLWNATNLYKIKLVQTKLETRVTNMSKIIKNYINLLPHKNLHILHFSLPNKRERINYVRILDELNLLQLRIYLSVDKDFNDLEQIIPLLEFNEKQKNKNKTSIELIFYTPFDRRTIQFNLKEVENKLSKFNEIKLEHKLWPFVA